MPQILMHEQSAAMKSGEIHMDFFGEFLYNNLVTKKPRLINSQ